MFVLQSDDVSDSCSTVSRVESIHSLSGDSGFRQPVPAATVAGSRRRHARQAAVASVHGQKEEGGQKAFVQVARLNRQLNQLRTENADLYQKQANFVTGHKEDVLKLKSQLFSLTREKAGFISVQHLRGFLGLLCHLGIRF